jgi:hypothetical protein
VRADGALGLFVSSNFLHFAFALFVVSVAVMTVVSALTAPPPPANVGHRDPAVDRQVRERRHGDLGWTLGLIARVGVVWWYFS